MPVQVDKNGVIGWVLLMRSQHKFDALFLHQGMVFGNHVRRCDGDVRMYHALWAYFNTSDPRIPQVCWGTLLILYIGAAVFGYTHSRLCMVSHIILAAILYQRAQRVSLKSHKQITSFYMFVWKLFFLEYAMFPFY